MQQVDHKSIDLSLSFAKDFACAFPISPTLLPGVYWWGFVRWHTPFIFFDLLLREVMNGRGAYQVEHSYPGSFVCTTLSESLRWSKCLMALVIWLLWRVLWWMVMQCGFEFLFWWCLNDTTGYMQAGWVGCLTGLHKYILKYIYSWS